MNHYKEASNTNKRNIKFAKKRCAKITTDILQQNNKKMKPIKKHINNNRCRCCNNNNNENPFKYDHNNFRQIQRTPSDNSLIYVPENIPIIDLTKSSHNILYKSRPSSSSSRNISSATSLHLIYKSNNFQNQLLPKRFTSSLLTIPLLRHHQQPQKLTNFINSSQLIKPTQKLSVLDIPPEFLDDDTDGSEYAFQDLSKADLNQEDKNIIECILMNEEASTFLLQSKTSVEDMCIKYGVSAEDNFDDNLNFRMDEQLIN